MKNEDLNKGGFDLNRVLDFCRKNIRYISAGIVVVVLVIVLAVTAVNQNKKNGEDKEQQKVSQEQEGQEGQEEAFAVDAIPEINALVDNYYAAYVTGDITSLETYAAPVSEIEKGYINVVSQYITGYENIKCYTKAGAAEGEYAVYVVADMRLKEIEATAPGLEFFYVRTNENGVYYIDNAYRKFNDDWNIQEKDSRIEALIAEYDAQDDIVQLIEDVQSRYDEVVAANPEWQKRVEEVNAALKEWADQIIEDARKSEEEAQPEEENEQSEEEAQPEEENEQSEEEAQPEEESQPEETENTEEAENQTSSETVYVTDNVNIRKEPDESAEKAGSAEAGQSFTRTGTTEDGWSEIEYNGAKAYIKSDYVSTEAPTQPAEETEAAEEENGDQAYVPEGTVLTMNSGLNVRTSMSETSECIGTTGIGDEVKVVLSYAEGWTKVEWNGQTGYIRTDLLLNN